MKQAASGDARAFDLLAQQWWKPLYRMGMRLAGNREDAEDICQETLAKAHRSLRELSDHRKFSVWLHRIALHVYQDRRRRERSRPTVSLEVVREEVESVSLLERLGRPDAMGGGPSDDIEAWELRQMLQEALDTLPEEQREAIVLREFQGLSTTEIAEIMGVPTATVRTRIFYGLRKLHDVLSPPLGRAR